MTSYILQNFLVVHDFLYNFIFIECEDIETTLTKRRGKGNGEVHFSVVNKTLCFFVCFLIFNIYIY